MEGAVLKIIGYRPEHQPWFEKFNRAWIERYFRMEPIDVQVLRHPQEHIVDPGGSIFMAQWDGELAGAVAMKFVAPGIYEMTKMAVDDQFQGKGIGRALAEGAIAWAGARKADKVVLYSSSKLETALALYRKLGFQHVPVDGPYKRSDVKMELVLTSNHRTA